MLQLLRYLNPYRRLIVLLVLLLSTQAFSWLLLPTLMADIVDRGIVGRDVPYVLRLGGLMLLVTLGGTVGAVCSFFLSSRVANAFARDLRREVFRRVEGFSLHEFDRFGAATLITRTTNDVTQVQQLVLMGLRVMIFAPLINIGSIVMAVSRDATLSLAIVIALPLLAAAIWWIASRSMLLSGRMQQRLDRINRVVRENLTGIRVIRAFNRTDYERARFTAANRDLTETAIQVNMLMASLMPAMMLILNLTVIGVAWFGAVRVGQDQMQVGDLMAFIQYIMHVLFSLLFFSMFLMQYPRAAASAARINEVLQVRPALADPPEPLAAEGVQGRLEFRDVTFRYPGAEQPALQGISFRAGPGEVTAVIGGTGSGKSTLASLILRFYDVDSGAVLVDGIDVRQMTQESLRAKIGYVAQTSLLFSGTIEENIRFGKEGASPEEVRRAAQVAQAADFIDGRPEGFGASVAQGGANLSGGQRQRLSIARALVRRPEIYLFDDSFSSLDFKTDARLRAALREETAGSAVLIVAQRVSTVMDADRIVVLDAGRIAGTGRHADLLQTCSVYREIVASQLGEELA
jgi:ATP-binding cassette, subfamily B, multidrug efflux pump